MDAKSPYREPGALGLLRAAAHVCDRRVGLNRIGFVLSVAIIAVAAVVLYRILRNIDFHEVIEALVTTKWRDIALAAAVVAGGYFTLTFYDLFALRTIGRLTSLIGSPRSPGSPAIRSGTMSAPASSPAARCATAFIRHGGSAPSRWRRCASSPV